MITSASWPPVVLNRSSTASSIEARSPVPVVPLNTPQSMRMYFSPAAVGTVTRKKSPKPTRYMRTLRPLALAGAFFVDVFFFLPALISEASVQHVEVELEAFRVVSLVQSFAQAEVALARFAALVIEAFGDQIADWGGSIFPALERRLGNQQRRAAAHRKRPHARPLGIERHLRR